MSSVGGAMVNVLTFFGSNYFFLVISSSDVYEERKRLNETLDRAGSLIPKKMNILIGATGN